MNSKSQPSTSTSSRHQDTYSKYLDLINEYLIEPLKDVVDQCQLSQLINKFPNGFDSNLGDRGVVISGGELQRIGIARALYKDSEILVLDEFTSALDDRNELKLIELIKKLSYSKTIIISSHKKKLFNFCDSIFLVKDKKIININE